MQTKQKLMILEDDILTQDAYLAVFSKTNEFDLVFCNNDVEFYQAIEESHFDIFLMDLALGTGKDGVQLIKELRQIEKYRSTPIVVVTAFTMLQDEQITMEAGATKFIRKPIDNRELVRIFRQVLNRKNGSK